MQQLANLYPVSGILVVCLVFVAGEATVQTVQTKQSFVLCGLPSSLSLSLHSLFYLYLLFSPLYLHSTMDARTAESPMDFEWQTRAPGDVTSPFYQLSVHHDNQRKRMLCPLSAPSPLTVQVPTMSSTRPKRNNLPLSASPIPSPSSSPSRDRRTPHQPRRPSLASPLS
jgi:hypothetical protein